MGLEIGADIYSCNLDDYMVFNNNDVQTLFFLENCFIDTLIVYYLME